MEFAELYYVHTAGGITASAEKELHDYNVRILTVADINRANLRWPAVGTIAAPKLGPPREPLPHQTDAINDTVQGLREQDRGKLIMACGTGKTFTALRVAEQMVGPGKRVLFIVPSIALINQAMREWAEHKRLPHRYAAVCSDTSAGRTAGGGGGRLYELAMRPTTTPDAIYSFVNRQVDSTMTVVFCTYQSLDAIATAQDGGATEFDLIICDEAHRTTGVEKLSGNGEDAQRVASQFQLVHNNDRIRGAKRLYMTATPKLYTAAGRPTTTHRDTGIYTMDDAAVYGGELHHLKF